MSDYTKELTNAVLDTSHDGTLHVSVGTADFVTPWLTRLYAEAVHGGPSPNFNHLVIKHLNFDKASQLEKAGAFKTNFVAKLKMNIEALQTDPAIKAAGIACDTREWPVLPLFHGYLVGAWFLIGQWLVGQGGQLHVRTSLYKSTEKQLPNIHAFLRSSFA